MFLDLYERNIPLQNNRKHHKRAASVIKVLKSSEFEHAASTLPVWFFITMENIFFYVVRQQT